MSIRSSNRCGEEEAGSGVEEVGGITEFQAEAEAAGSRKSMSK